MLMQPHSLMELSGNAFHLLPSAQGGVYKGLGAFLRRVVVGIFFFLFTHTPLRNSASPFYFLRSRKTKPE